MSETNGAEDGAFTVRIDATAATTAAAGDPSSISSLREEKDEAVVSPAAPSQPQKLKAMFQPSEYLHQNKQKRASSHSNSHNHSHNSSTTASHHHNHQLPPAPAPLPITLHSSSSTLTPLPSFSHSSLSAYQLFLSPDIAGDIFGVRYNTNVSVEEKTAVCLKAMERLAKEGVRGLEGMEEGEEEENGDGGEEDADDKDAEEEKTFDLDHDPSMSFPSTPRIHIAQSAPKLDGLPLRTHRSALRSTILNLHAMLVPLLIAPREPFEQGLRNAQETARKYGVGGAWGEDRSDGNDSSATGEPHNDGSNHHTDAGTEEKMRKIDQALREHDGSHERGKNEEEEKQDHNNSSNTSLIPSSSSHSSSSYPLHLTSPSLKSGLSSNMIPYSSLITSYQQLKTQLSKKLLLQESTYLEILQSLYSKSEDVSYLKETNRQKDLKYSNSYVRDMRQHDEYLLLREKLNENYSELKKLRTRNQEMKQNMKKLGSKIRGMNGNDGSGGGSGGGKNGSMNSKDKNALTASNTPNPHQHKHVKKLYEDLIMSLKERSDEHAKYQTSIAISQNEKENLTTQVEILEQAVQTMRYMIKEMVGKMDAGGGCCGNATVTTPPSNTTATNNKNLIACRGIGPSVPPFLAYSGWVRRYSLGKRNTELIIKEIWSLKTIMDEQRRKSGLKRTTLQDFFMFYLKSRFPLPRLNTNVKLSSSQQQLLSQQRSQTIHRKFEFVYNFISACQQYRSDHDMDLFYKILFHECSEERYIDQMTMMAYFKKCLTQCDIIDGVRDGYIQKTVFFAGLRQFFPVKSEANMRVLIEIVLREMQTKANLGTGTVMGVGGSGGGNNTTTTNGKESKVISRSASNAILASGSTTTISNSASSSTLTPSSASAAGGGTSTSSSNTTTNPLTSPGEWVIDISKLMAETSDGDESSFINAIRNQYEEEVNAFPEEIEKELRYASKMLFGGEGGSGGQNTTRSHTYTSTHNRHHTHSTNTTPCEGWLPAGQIASILQELDPNKSKHDIEFYMKRGLGLDGYFVLNRETTGSSASGNTTTASATASSSSTHHPTSSHTTTSSHSKFLRESSTFSNSRGGTPLQTQRDMLASHGHGSSSSGHSAQGQRKGSFSLPSANPHHQHRESHSSGGGTPSQHHHDRTSSSTAGMTSLGLPGIALNQSNNSTSKLPVRRMSIDSHSGTATPMSPPHPPVSSQSHQQQGVSHANSRRTSASPESGGTVRFRSISPAPAASSSHDAHSSTTTAATQQQQQQSSSSTTSLLPLGSTTSYDPCHFVELTPFLTRLNSLFLHRTGHYTSELDIPGLGKLIKDELEKQSEDERKLRELQQARRLAGNSTIGLQVNSKALVTWNTIFQTWKRGSTEFATWVREENYSKVAKRYAKSTVSSSSTSSSTDLIYPLIHLNPNADGDMLHENDEFLSLKYPIDPYLNTLVTVWRGDSTKLQIDAIVNAANPQLIAGGGICASIFNAAGHTALSKACARLGGCEYGKTKLTQGFKLPAKYILHSVSPVDNTDSAALVSCYTSILDLCLKRGIKSVAFCCLGTGIYGFPHIDACEIALRTTREWLMRDDRHKTAFERIVFCVFTEEDLTVYQALMTLFFPCSVQTERRGSTTLSGTVTPKPQSSSSNHKPLTPTTASPIVTATSSTSSLQVWPVSSYEKPITTAAVIASSSLANDSSSSSAAMSKKASQTQLASASELSNRLAGKNENSTTASVAATATSFTLPPVFPLPASNPSSSLPTMTPRRVQHRYSAPSKPVVKPRTASELFCEEPVLEVVAVSTGEDESIDATSTSREYTTQRTGSQSNSRSRSIHLSPSSRRSGSPSRRRFGVGGGASPRVRGQQGSVHGLAKLVRHRTDEEKEDGEDEEDEDEE